MGRCSYRVAPDLVVADERTRGVREPGRVLQRPDEGNAGSHGYGPGGRESGAATGVQPAGPRVSLYTGGGGGQRPEPAAGSRRHEVEVDVVAVGRRPGQVHGGGDGDADDRREPLREQDIGQDRAASRASSAASRLLYKALISAIPDHPSRAADRVFRRGIRTPRRTAWDRCRRLRRSRRAARTGPRWG